ncbi:MAG: trypsin-like peptidase domain-containing protein [Bacteroidales bacterium]|nr:trypsin-like peptidase domain-containing protein [Bacteroidales bacterium]
MKTTVKSFLGAAAGTAVILLVYTLAFNHQHNISREQSVMQTKTVQPSPPIKAASFYAPGNTDFVEAAQKSVDAVVHIKTIIGMKPQHYDDFFGQLRDYLYGRRPANSTLVAFGSGVIISPDGYIVTNNHVVAGADKITVTFNNKQELTAKVIGTSASSDLAVIKVDAKDLPYLTYGNSDDLKVGQWVLAVGNPFNLTSTVTAGIVSAKARDIHIPGAQSDIESFIQTDAAVNPGNSGGALVNTQGQLVGINTAIASKTGAYEGYSFAIPVNLVKKVVGDLMKYGHIQRAYLGIQIRDIDEQLAKEKGLKNLEGVYVAEVIQPGGASEAGMHAGDIIKAVNGKPVKGIATFMEILGQYSPGNVIQVTIQRDHHLKTLKVTLKNREGSLAVVKAEHPFFNDKLGVELKGISDATMNRLRISHGLRITRVEDGILSNGGISKNFIITEVNNHSVSNKKTLEAALKISSQQNGVVKMKGMYPNGMKISFEFML